MKLPKVSTLPKLKLLAILISVLPVGFLLFFLIGETIDGMEGSIVHLAQLLPVLAILIFAWKKPQLGGVILVVIGALLALIYAGFMNIPTPALLIVEAVLFLPPIASGILFIYSHKKKS